MKCEKQMRYSVCVCLYTLYAKTKKGIRRKREIYCEHLYEMSHILEHRKMSVDVCRYAIRTVGSMIIIDPTVCDSYISHFLYSINMYNEISLSIPPAHYSSLSCVCPSLHLSLLGSFFKPPSSPCFTTMQILSCQI